MSSFQLSKILKPAAARAFGSRRSMRQIFLAGDRLRHRPVGIGLEAAHDRLDLRRRILGRADDHQALEGRLAVVDEDHRVVAGIDQHVTLAEILRQPAPALEVGHDLLDALVDRGVERQRRLGADDAVDRQALGLLVGLHHAGQRLVVEIGHRARLGNREVELGQALAQQRHARVDHAGLERDAVGQRREGWPWRACRAIAPAPSAAPGSRPWAAARRGRRRNRRPRRRPSADPRARPCAAGCRCPCRRGWRAPARSTRRWHRRRRPR